MEREAGMERRDARRGGGIHRHCLMNREEWNWRAHGITEEICEARV